MIETARRMNFEKVDRIHQSKFSETESCWFLYRISFDDQSWFEWFTCKSLIPTAHTYQVEKNRLTMMSS